MLQEDSNGETTFEIIDKKAEELSESLSSVSSSISLLPSPGVSLANVPSSTTGNLLSNVAPPSALPSFIPAAVPTPISTFSTPTSLTANVLQSHPVFNLPVTTVTTTPSSSSSLSAAAVTAVDVQPTVEPYYPTQFSAAIPPCKGVQHGTIPEKVPPASDDSGGFIGWMKGAVATGGILSRVAEKAKNSVDSMITTLDPQMREYIYSGGDLDVLVASCQEVKISPIREAFQAIFGKATVSGISVQATNIAAQPVGFAAGIKAAEERVQGVFKNPNVHPVPVVAVENFLLEVGEDKWYDLGVLLLYDPARQITLQTFTQMTPVPTAVVTLAQEDTPSDYPLKWSGYSVTIGSLMAKNLATSHTEWHQALTGVSRREMILLAAKTLASLYKSSLTQG
ncbi:hypothetical protein ILUMI_21931 [Ignelater luminosus]|uniref:Non-canonical purine NTP phosphatase/PRRC1 domain-containing protein n=1 Tax=Ignelater luminosus TaxID=2038154 RepID=A0A8K0CDN3_IGNLU|nr:hypothetical protein ILUMI_21931 [Ignelater luminosus]